MVRQDLDGRFAVCRRGCAWRRLDLAAVSARALRADDGSEDNVQAAGIDQARVVIGRCVHAFGRIEGRRLSPGWLGDRCLARGGVCRAGGVLSRCGRFGNRGFQRRPAQERAEPGAIAAHSLNRRWKRSRSKAGCGRSSTGPRSTSRRPTGRATGGAFFFNRGGRIYTLPVAGGAPALLTPAKADRCNNDHGLSPDGRWLAISHTDPGLRQSVISIVAECRRNARRGSRRSGPRTGMAGRPTGRRWRTVPAQRRVRHLHDCRRRAAKRERLTTAQGLDDGPDYSPDGKHIYFNSERTGTMKIWRMNADGSGQEQVTAGSDYVDWFPHPSPDGKWLVFLSYDKSVDRPPGRQGRAAANHAAGGRHPARSGDALRRPGDDQRAIVVARTARAWRL